MRFNTTWKKWVDEWVTQSYENERARYTSNFDFLFLNRYSGSTFIRNLFELSYISEISRLNYKKKKTIRDMQYFDPLYR